MATSFNAAAAAAAILSGVATGTPTQRTHVVFAGTSQSSVNVKRFNDWALEHVLPARIAPIVARVGRTVPYGGSVSMWGDLSASAPITRVEIGGNDSDTQYDANSSACVVCPVARQTFASDLGASAALGNGFSVQGGEIDSWYNAALRYDGSGTRSRSWFARLNAQLRMKLVVLNTPGAIPVSYFTRVMTASGSSRFQAPVSDSTAVNLTPSATGDASAPFVAGPWTAAVSDPGYADRDIRCPISCNNGNEAAGGAHFTPVAFVVETLDAGVRPKGVILDMMGRASSDTRERLSQMSLAALTSYYAATIDDDVDVIVVIIDGEHNANAAHLTTGLFNATYKDEVQQEMQRHLNAAKAAKPGKRVIVVRNILWRVVAGAAGLDSIAQIQSCEARVQEACIAIGSEAGYINLAEILNYSIPATDDIHLVNGAAAATLQAQQSTRAMSVAGLFVGELMRIAGGASGGAGGAGFARLGLY